VLHRCCGLQPHTVSLNVGDDRRLSRVVGSRDVCSDDRRDWMLGNDIGAIMGSLAESLGIGENNRTMDVFRLVKLLDGSIL
jgi:hypothetical protein